MTDPALAPTRFIDSDHPAIRAFAAAHAGTGDERSRAVALAAAVREAVPYSLWSFQLEPRVFVASNVLSLDATFCAPKAVLLAAVARAAGIASRVGFADVRNHLSSPRFAELMDTPDFHWHAYTALRIGGQWLKATPAFDSALCLRHGVPVLEFDGRRDSIFQPFDAAGRRHMDYLTFHGEFDDMPYDRMAAELSRIYPRMLTSLARMREERAG
ncbi:MAG: hypothetical protein CVT80_02670 [Alphaproteobacteria bacterium HGW-Alphaproteobacteria-2]|nr:MAG: hypothetical protein CVT80_02670 [Alphaproteobacteria bacterium HGW-Alphaproteobacteria-2]